MVEQKRPTLLDAWGKPLELREFAGTGFQHPIQVGDRDYDYSIRGLAPTGLWAAIVSAQGGDVSALQSYFEQAISRDGHLHSLDQRRRRGVSGLEFELRPYQERPGWEYKDGKLRKAEGKYEDKDLEVCQMVQDVLWRIPNFQEQVETMLDAVGKGFSVLQINWIDDGGLLRPFLRSIPQRKFTFAKDDPEAELEREWPTILTDDSPMYGEDISPARYIVAVYRDRNVEAWKCGLMWPSLWFYLRKNEGWSQNMATGERYANPPLVGYVAPEAWNSQVISTVQNAMKRWGPGSSVIVPGTGEALKDVDVVKGVPRGAFITQPEVNLKLPADFWQMTREDCNREMSKIWTLGNLTTDVIGVGSKAATESQRDTELEDTRKPDVDWLACGPLYRLIELIVFYNKGAEAAKRLPVLTCPALEPEDDILARATKFKTIGETNWDAVRDAPLEVRDELDIPEMEPPEEPEEPPPGQVPPGQQPPNGQQPPPPNGQQPPQGQPPVPPKPVPPKVEASCDCAERFEAKAAPGANELKKLVDELVAMVDPLTTEARGRIRDRVTTHLLRMKTAPKNPEAFAKAVVKHVDAAYEPLSAELKNAGMEKWFEDTYRHYKTTDRSLWGTRPVPPTALEFGGPDLRMARQMSKSTNWFFSKFTDNETYRKPMQDFLIREYAEKGAQLNVQNPETIKAFAKKLGDTAKELADHEIERIARTSVARARENARIMQMRSAGVSKAQVNAHPDACPICAAYSGQAIDVQAAAAEIEALEALEGDAWVEAVRAQQKQSAKGVPPHEFSDGAGGPLYHPNCRCGVTMAFEDYVSPPMPEIKEPERPGPAEVKPKPTKPTKAPSGPRLGTEPVTIQKGKQGGGYKIPTG